MIALNGMLFVKLFIGLMPCVTPSSMSILVNGCPADEFLPTRGIYQWDPIPPFEAKEALSHSCEFISFFSFLWCCVISITRRQYRANTLELTLSGVSVRA